MNIVLDYGMGRLEILNGLYALRYDDNIFIQRSEQMISVGIPIKMWYYQQSEVNFNKYEHYSLNNVFIKKFVQYI